MTKAPIELLTEFDPTIGEYTVDVFRVNSKQTSTLQISRLSPDRVHVRIVNRNYYYEKGDTFNNWVTMYDKSGEPLVAFFSKRGVGERRPFRGSRKGRTDYQETVSPELLDQVAYIRMYSDNKGNSKNVIKKISDALEKGALKAVEKFAQDTIGALLPSSDDAKKAILGK